MGGSQRLRGRQRTKQAGKALIQVRDTKQVKENAFIYTQRAARERAPGSELDQSPATQRTARCDCLPGRARQDGQCQTEARKGIALHLRAKLREGAVEFDSGTEQQDIAL